MQTYLPSLKQMQYLVALHEHGHFGRAANACNVTQSTLSAGIRELETLLGPTLVERTRRVVRFTALGNAIVEKAHRVLREAEELADMAAAAAAPLVRSEEHTSELQSLMRISYAVFCLNKKKNTNKTHHQP